jgi:hypothetical protein
MEESDGRYFGHRYGVGIGWGDFFATDLFRGLSYDGTVQYMTLLDGGCMAKLLQSPGYKYADRR